MKAILLRVWAEQASLGNAKTALKFKQAMTHTIPYMEQGIAGFIGGMESSNYGKKVSTRNYKKEYLFWIIARQI